MSIDAIGLDVRDRLIEGEDYEPELFQSDKKRLLNDEVDQIAGLLLDDGPELFVGGRGDHVEEEDARPSSSKGKGDLTNPDSLASMKKECSGLIDQGLFDWRGA